MLSDWAAQCQSDGSTCGSFAVLWTWKWRIPSICSSIEVRSRQCSCQKNYEKYSHSVNIPHIFTCEKSGLHSLWHWIYNFRLEIEDVRSDSKFQQITPAKQITSKPAITATNDDYDEELRKLIIPKKIVRSKLSAAMSNIKQLCSDKKPTKYSK